MRQSSPNWLLIRSIKTFSAFCFFAGISYSIKLWLLFQVTFVKGMLENEAVQKYLISTKQHLEFVKEHVKR